MANKKNVKSADRPILGFRISPELKQAIFVEAAFAGITVTELMEEASREKVEQMREKRKAEEESEPELLAAA